MGFCKNYSFIVKFLILKKILIEFIQGILGQALLHDLLALKVSGLLLHDSSLRGQALNGRSLDLPALEENRLLNLFSLKENRLRQRIVHLLQIRHGVLQFHILLVEMFDVQGPKPP